MEHTENNVRQYRKGKGKKGGMIRSALLVGDWNKFSEMVNTNNINNNNKTMLWSYLSPEKRELGKLYKSASLSLVGVLQVRVPSTAFFRCRHAVKSTLDTTKGPVHRLSLTC